MYINHILCLLQPFFSSKSQSVAFRKEQNDKSSNTDKKSTFNILSSCCPLRKRAQLSNVCLFWRGSHFDTCESLGSSSVKMSQAFHDPSICFNFSYLHRKVNTFKTPLKCAFLQLFFQDLFIILSLFLAGSSSVKMLQAFHDPSINFGRAWER